MVEVMGTSDEVFVRKLRSFASRTHLELHIDAAMRGENAEEDYIDVYASSRARRVARHAKAASTTLESQRRERHLLLEAVTQQKELLDVEQKRADDAEDELEKVTAQADALSKKLDDLMSTFMSRKLLERTCETPTPSSSVAATSTLQLENERLKREMYDMEKRHAAEVADLRADLRADKPNALTAEERRRLLTEIAEARKEIAVAKEARAKALSEAIDLRTKLESLGAAASVNGVSGANNASTPPKTPEWANIDSEWANIDWDAAYAEMDSIKAEKQRITPKLDSGKLPSLEEEIDWEAAYSDIDATRARRKILS
tara:strand:+ start:2664 stop:3611 length:948 start_codon:yes stop_codon:yes gene_type:complete